MWEVSPRSGLRYAVLPLSAMGFEQASVGVWPTPSRTHLCCEDVLSRRGLRLPPECACRGAVAGGRTQSSAEKYVPDPTSEASVRARRPRNREGPGGAVRRSQAQAASDAQPHLGGQEHESAQHQQQPDGVGRRLLEDFGVRAGVVHRG